jgi:predicted HTH transcriptional regulator
MAKYELKFIDATEDGDWIKCKHYKGMDSDLILIDLCQDGNENCVFLDKSTAIFFAEALRTEINKIKEEDTYSSKEDSLSKSRIEIAVFKLMDDDVDFNRTKLAKELGISRKTIHRYIKKYKKLNLIKV